MNLDQQEAEPPQSEMLEAVRALPEKYREAIYLFYYEEYSIGEIAALTGRSEAAVSAQHAREGEDSAGSTGAIHGFDTNDRKDFDELELPNMESWWNGGQGQTLVEEAAGTAQDGWSAKRVFQGRWGDQDCLFHKYRAERLSDLNTLWDVWDTTWLEEHYTPIAGQTLFEQEETGGEPYRTLVLGQFRGQGDTVFNIQYSWLAWADYGDQDYLSDGLDHHEVYTTADGAKATIMTATTHSGKTLFWVSVISGHSYFSMFGTQVEMYELYTILDSLHLSNLLETIPAQ